MESFSRLGFAPREGQVAAVNQILEAYIDEGKRNVILNASTGTGKSIIGAVVAETYSTLKGNKVGPKSSISLTATNVLAEQYETSFIKIAEIGQYAMIKGAGNYDCTALSTPEQAETADACAWYTMVQESAAFQATLDTHCSRCEYLGVKKKRNQVRHLTTNYSFYFIDRLYSGMFEDRDLIVWDEAHLINDLFSEHNAIHFSQKSLMKAAMDIADKVGLTDQKIAKLIKTIGQDCAVPDKINETNYRTYILGMKEIYAYAKEQGGAGTERALRQGNMKQYSALRRFVREYEGKFCKIDDLFNFEYDHVFEYNKEEKSVTIKPIFVGNMMDALYCGDESKNLFMSATVSEGFMTKTLQLDPAKTKFIKLEPTFPKESKEVVFLDPISLNYTSMQDPKTIKKLRSNIRKIVEHHLAKSERGIILAPSFKVAKEAAEELANVKGMKIFEHRQGEKLIHILDAFKLYKGGPAVLISPSMYEGIDLPGDLSRFQILVKAPFPSLGDRRMKYILDRHPDIYNTITIMKMVQGAGRSVRSMDDHATTYVLDINGKRVFTSSTNIWQNEFKMRFASEP